MIVEVGCAWSDGNAVPGMPCPESGNPLHWNTMETRDERLRLLAWEHLAIVGAAMLISWVFLSSVARGEILRQSNWTTNPLAIQKFEIHGTESRNNPLRKKLESPFTGDELFVRYRIRYDAGSLDTPPEDEGEFVVLWLNREEGTDGSTHSGGIPNIGIHVKDNENRFMVRFASNAERFGGPVEGDRDYLVVARLWKSEPGAGNSFNQLDLWVDPQPGSEFEPEASTSSRQSISSVDWIGLSTGAKTELEDRITVWDIDLARTWRGILELPPRPANEEPAPVIRKEPTIDFARHVFPILESKCFKCHQGEKAKKEIRLDIHDEVLNLTTPGKAKTSPLYDLVSRGEMPPGKETPLTPGEKAVLATWIEEGVTWDETLLPTPPPTSDHWSFQPIKKPEIPSVKNPSRIRTPIDAFVASRQESMGITPSPEASPSTLRRRISLDLLGLPVTDSREETIDSLLANPAFGERWARHWLDVARWAESNGHQHNRHRPHSWRYRDWVIGAFNSGMPFDEFLTSQIAGDERDRARNGDLVATGFLAAARYSGNELDKDIQRNDILVDIVNTTGNAFLGLTFECAQCHSHKFDPISIRDYYRMQAFFARGQPMNLSFFSEDAATIRDRVEERWDIFDRTYDRQVQIRRKRGVPNAELVIPKTVIKSISATDRKRFETLEREIASIPQTWGYFSPSGGLKNEVVAMPHEMRWPLDRDPEKLAQMESRILLRGDVRAPGPVVEPGWPIVFGSMPERVGRPRTALAEWLTNRDNPLTARVWVNRIWQWHFGRGIVETSGDFGAQGTGPTHPELLDYLAAELMEHDWDTRHIHRLILGSSTYRQSSHRDSENHRLDPENRSWWRWMPRRLEAEAIRDSMLAVAGLLDPRMGGPSDPVDSGSRRRSLYLVQRRDNLPSQQTLFDSANGVVSCSKRRVSTTSLQPLWLMNSTFSQEVSAALARRAGSVESAFALALGRAPDEFEKKKLESLARRHGLESACLAIINSSEFVYIP